MRKLAILAYGAIAYLAFLAAFLYLIGFLGNFAVPKTVDGGPGGPLGAALLVDALLVALFGLQHSVMARPSFKRRWTRLVPASVERSTYVLLSSAVLAVLFAAWRPIATPVWNVEMPVLRGALWALFGGGWALVVFSTLLIDHFDLFGLRQVWLRWRGTAYRPPGFRTPLLYRYVRHPIYVGWTLAFFATPAMSAGHLLFAVGMLAYMRLAIALEERNLLEAHPEYAEYRRRVPMLIPRPARRPAPARVAPAR